MSQITVFCYCGGRLGKVVPGTRRTRRHSTGTCRLIRRCDQCDAIYELDVKIDDPSAAELTILLREKENASAITA